MRGARPYRVLWLQSGGCGGCSMSLLNAEQPDLYTLLSAHGVELVWHPSLSESCGDDFLRLLADLESGREPFDALCLEGSVMRGPNGSGRFHQLAGSGRSMMEVIAGLAGRARHVLAIGSCAAFGGVTAAGGNLAEACGLQYEGEVAGGLLGAGWRSRGGLPVINVAGCPTHPAWVTDTLAQLARDELPEERLDALGRPRDYTDHLVHHGCPRNEYYEYKASAERPSDLGCMMENLGCLGTQARADCNIRPWNGGGSCLRGGYACINCTAPGFEEPGHAFAETPKIAGIPIGLPTDMPKAWFVALASLSKAATPRRLKVNAVADHVRVTPGASAPGRGKKGRS
ncbi:MAG TPA: HupU protein [Gammaproteobacteria bacterium]|nr:HupU protein [Gammaproteobacteria bacterium]